MCRTAVSQPEGVQQGAGGEDGTAGGTVGGMGRAAAGVAVGLLAGTILVGCSSGGAAARDDLEATLQRSTLFETQRALNLTVRSSPSELSGGDEEIRIRSIRLDSPRFAAVEPQERNARLRENDPTVVMPLRYGEAQCGDGAEGPAELVAEVDGEEVRLPLDEHPSDMLASLQANECAAARVFEDVSLRFGDEWQRTEPRTVEGWLSLAQREPGVRAVVDELVGNVIFGLAAPEGSASGPGLAVSDDRPSARIRVRIHAARCDPHALIEYKRTFTFSVWIRVGDRDPALVDVKAEGPAHEALERLLAACIG
jgi:hypothetical protein